MCKKERNSRDREKSYTEGTREKEGEGTSVYIFDAHGSPARRQTFSIVIIEVRKERTRVIKVSGVATIATYPGDTPVTDFVYAFIYLRILLRLFQLRIIGSHRIVSNYNRCNGNWTHCTARNPVQTDRFTAIITVINNVDLLLVQRSDCFAIEPIETARSNAK